MKSRPWWMEESRRLTHQKLSTLRAVVEQRTDPLRKNQMELPL
jgi:hypothetical protein